MTLSIVQPAFARDIATGSASEPIIVTARKKQERLLEVPASVSVITASEAQSLGEFRNIGSAVPNVAMNGGLAGQLQGQIAIRGIATLVRNIGVESGVGVYVDGAYVGRPEAYNQELLDVERIEVLRGPQGSLFGKNTIAGVLNIVGATPSRELSGRLFAEAGGFGLAHAQAIVSGPLAGDALLGRIAIAYVRRDGFDKHLSGGRSADSLDRLSWRGTLQVEATPAVSITLRTDGLSDRSVPGFFASTDLAIPGAPPALPRGSIDNNRPNRLDRDVRGLSATATAEIGGATLTSISAYRRSRYEASLDDDQRQIDLLAFDQFGDRTELWSQELRLAGPSDRELSYIAGVYLLDQDVRTERAIGLGTFTTALHGLPGAPALRTRGQVSTLTLAAFGTLDWRFAEGWQLSAGVRYTHERKTARFSQDDETGFFAMFGLPDLTFSGRSRDGNLSPTLSLGYAPGPGLNLYLRVARAFKSAAFNVDLAASPDGLSASPERATTVEAGARLFEGGGARLTLAFFHTRYDNLQVSQITGRGTALGNAAKAAIDGFEVEAAASLTPRLRLQGSLGLANGRYRRFDNCAVPVSEGGGAADCSGRRLAGAPRLTAAAAAEYVKPLRSAELTTRVELAYRSSIRFEPTNSPRFRARERTLLNARVSLRRGGLVASAWVENLTNAMYETYRDDRSALGVLRTTAFGPPRTWGVGLSRAF